MSDQAHPVSPANFEANVAVYGWSTRQGYERFMEAIGQLLRAKSWLLEWYSDRLREAWDEADRAVPQ